MSTVALRNAIKALAEDSRGLLTASPSDVKQHTMEWAPPKWVKGIKVEHSMGLWKTGDGNKLTLVLVGVIDLERSALGSYGNCYWDREFREHPTRKELSKSKFNIKLTYPILPAGHVDEDIVSAVAAQMYRLDEIQNSASEKMRDDGLDEPSGTTDWVTFEENDKGTQGWIVISLGSAFVPSVKKVKGKDITNRMPMQAATNGAPKKNDIEEDPEEHFQNAGKHFLRHNDKLPCFKPGGEQVGRTSAELRHELYHGRWVKAEVELVMWNLKDGNKRCFQLCAKRVDVLGVPAAAMGGIVYTDGSKASSSKTPSSGKSDTLSETEDSGTDAHADKKARVN